VPRLALVIASLFPVLAPVLACKDSEPAQPRPDGGSTADRSTGGGDDPDADPTPAIRPDPKTSDAAARLADQLDAAAYEADLRFIAATRPPGSAHWQAVQDRCVESLTQAGFVVERVTAEGAGTSVIGRKDGRDPKLPAIVFGAHYDHIEDCPGADDNASGTAAVLAVARTLGSQTWDRTVYAACWDEEENGLFGSEHWVDQAVAAGVEISLYLNFDAMGYADANPNSQELPPGSELLFAKQLVELEARGYRGDFIAMLADDAAHECCEHYLAHAARLELPTALLEIPGRLKNTAALSELRRSDHASFWKHDIPALFLSDTANYRTDTYHCMVRSDTIDTLDIPFAVKVTKAAAGTLAELL
jgi:hypothetical protein